MPLDGDYPGDEGSERRRRAARLIALADVLGGWSEEEHAGVYDAAKEVRRVLAISVSNIVDDIGDPPVGQFLDMWPRLGAEIIAEFLIRDAP